MCCYYFCCIFEEYEDFQFISILFNSPDLHIRIEVWGKHVEKSIREALTLIIGNHYLNHRPPVPTHFQDMGMLYILFVSAT
jgi:hypothetical protein